MNVGIVFYLFVGVAIIATVATTYSLKEGINGKMQACIYFTILFLIFSFLINDQAGLIPILGIWFGYFLGRRKWRKREYTFFKE